MPTALIIETQKDGDMFPVAETLSMAGWRVMTVHPGAQSDGARMTRTPAGGYRLRFDAVRRGSGPLAGLENGFGEAQGLQKLSGTLGASGFEPDVILGLAGSGATAAAPGLWPGVPLMVWLGPWRGGNGFDTDWAAPMVDLRSCAGADLILSASQTWIDSWPEIIAPIATVQPLGVDCSAPVAPPGSAADVPDMPRGAVFVTVGSGPGDFVPQIAQTMAEDPGLHLVAEGGVHEQLCWLVPEAAGRIHVLDQPQTAPALLKGSLAHCMLGEEDCEAALFAPMAAAMPIIIQDGRLAREVLPRPGMARFVSPHETGSLPQAIDWCRRNPKLSSTMGRRARARALNRYNSERCAQEICEMAGHLAGIATPLQARQN